uniref:THAP-type domain-containing protein n=1 Tax=Megaselia scalaris TaxID=36166 RepID=T1GSV6_MEGSC
MPSFCVVAGCPYKETHSESINFHKFPVAKDLLARWKQFAEKPDNWQPTRLSAICSNHFTLTNFRNVKNKYLKSSAIPTIKTPVVEFNADEATAKFLDQKRPREEMSVRKPVFIHSSDLFPEHRVQKKIKIPEKFKKEFPNISNQKVKIPLEYEDEGENMEETPQPSSKQEPSNDGSFYEQFLQNSGNSDVLNQNSQNYETIEVLAEDVMVQADSTENVGEEVQTAEIMEVTEDYLKKTRKSIHIVGFVGKFVKA